MPKVKKETEASNTDLMSDLLEMSFIDIITLMRIISLPKQRILRYALYKEINRISQPSKRISTSSFYNSLQKLKEMGYLRFHEKNQEARTIEVSPTPTADKLVSFLFFYLIQFQAGTTRNKRSKITPEIIFSLTQRDHFSAILIIEPASNTSYSLIGSVIPSATETIRTLALSSEKTFLVSTTEFFSKYTEMGLQNINPSSVMADGTIREPNDYFDLIIFPLYGRNMDYFGKSFSGILAEAKRLLRSDGKLLIIHLEPIKPVNHYLIQLFVEALKKSGAYFSFTAKEITSELRKIGFHDFNSRSECGVSFVVCSVLKERKQ